MDYRFLGRSGVRVAPLALGTMNFGAPTPEDESIRILHTAVERGINLIDTANTYNQGESERIIGRALAGGLAREKIVLATKFFNPTGDGPNDRGGSRLHIFRTVEASLRRLQTETIDLLQMHRPDFTTPMEETLRALDDLVRQGKVRYIGSSTYPAWRLMEALMLSEMKNLVRFNSEQPPYNLLERRVENEVVPVALAYRVALLPWSPLAMGLLAGRYPADGSLPADSRAARRGGIFADRVNSPRGLQVAARMAEMARERGLSQAQLALLWVKDQPAVTAPIIGPRSLAQLEEFLPLLEMRLSDADRPAFDELVPPGCAVADFYNTSGWMKQRAERSV